MKRILIAAIILAMTSNAGARQATTQFLISTRISAGNPSDAGSVQLLSSPKFRIPAGRQATMNLVDAVDGFRIVVTPSDLGAGKIALRVSVERSSGAQVQTSTFDVLTGSETSSPTVALRDGSGAFMLDRLGRPLFAEFQTAIR